VRKMNDLNRIRLLLADPLATVGEVELFERHHEKRENRRSERVAANRIRGDLEIENERGFYAVDRASRKQFFGFIGSTSR
jgi:hypothetical protein